MPPAEFLRLLRRYDNRMPVKVLSLVVPYLSYDDTTVVSPCLMGLSSLQHLHLEGVYYSSRFLRTLSQQCPQLNTLVLLDAESVDAGLSEEGVVPLSQLRNFKSNCLNPWDTCAVLRHSSVCVSLSWTIGNMSWKYCAAPVYQYLAGGPVGQAADTENEVLDPSKQLVDLDLRDHCHCLTCQRAMMACLERCTQLQHLKLDFDTLPPDADLVGLLAAHPRLVSLSIDKLDLSQVREPQRLAALTQLRKVELLQCHVSQDFLRALGDHVPSITKLVYDLQPWVRGGPNSFSKNSLEIVAQFSSLRCLVVEGHISGTMSLEDIADGLSHLPHLSELSIEYAELRSLTALQHLTKKLKALKQLAVPVYRDCLTDCVRYASTQGLALTDSV